MALSLEIAEQINRITPGLIGSGQAPTVEQMDTLTQAGIDPAVLNSAEFPISGASGPITLPATSAVTEQVNAVNTPTPEVATGTAPDGTATVVATPFTQDINTSILQSLGMQGTAGEGRGNQFLAENPHLIPSYEEARRRFQGQDTFVSSLRETIAPGIPVTDQMAANVTNPTLPQGAAFTPTNIPLNSSQNIQGPTPLQYGDVDIPDFAPIPVPTIDGTSANASNVNINDIVSNLTSGSGTVDPTLTTAQEEIKAAQGSVNKMSTVQGQMEDLLKDFEDGNTPAWAQGAMNKAEDILAARNLGSSTIASGAIVAAIQQAALPIASQDAATYFQMDLTNLNNEQQVRLENGRIRQQNMLTDVSIQNATDQFNATNELQKEQFTANMVANIATQNATFAQQAEVFNTAESNKIEMQNANNVIMAEQFDRQMQLAINEFNSNINNQREQYNNTMAFAIEQSNVVWRRQVNTQNTAIQNAANAANAQNRFNMSQTALNNIWQQFRDEQSWMFSASESERTRQYNAAQAANNRSFNSRNDDDWLEAAGKFAFEFFA